MSKIILTGGGTAGHVMPHLAILPYLKANFDEIHYIGSNGIEKNIISKHKEIIYHSVTSAKLERRFTIKNLLIPFKVIKGIKESKAIIKQIKPNVIFSKGGYVAVPVAKAGKQLNIPIIAHESDITMGLANKIIYKYCDKMCFSFKALVYKYKEKGIYTASPIRTELYLGKKCNVYSMHKLNKQNPTLLFFGGSLGAKSLNNLVHNCIEILSKTYNIIHIVGKDNAIDLKIPNYIQLEFVDNIADYYDIADIVICRAGSNSIFELLTLKKPMLLIPLPKDCSRGDQILNAEYFKSQKFAEVLDQHTTTPTILIQAINTMYHDKQVYINNMNKVNFDGTKMIANIIINASKE